MSFDNSTTRSTGNPADFQAPISSGGDADYAGSQGQNLGTTDMPGNRTVGHPPGSAVGEDYSNGGQMYGEGLRAQQQHTSPQDWDPSLGSQGQGQGQNDQQDQGDQANQEGVSVGDRIKGNAQKIAGRATFNPGMVEQGEQRKTGQTASNF